MWVFIVVQVAIESSPSRMLSYTHLGWHKICLFFQVCRDRGNGDV